MLRTAATIAEEYLPLVSATKGIVFLSTPHSGSEIASVAGRIGLLLRPTVGVVELEAHAPIARFEALVSKQYPTIVYRKSRPLREPDDPFCSGCQRDKRRSVH
jgi:hypothetical protein